MKQYLVILVVINLSGICFAQNLGDSLSGSWTTGFSNQYINWPGKIPHDDPIWYNEVQFDYELTDNLSAYTGTWLSSGLDDDWDRDGGDEIDLYLGCRFPVDLNGIGLGRLSTDFRASYFFLHDLSHVDDDQWALEARLSLPDFPIVEPYARVRYFCLHDPGFLGWAGIKRSQSFEICDWEGSMTPYVECAFNSGAIGGESGFTHGRAGVSIGGFRLWQFDISPWVFYQFDINDRSFTGEDHWNWGVNASIGF